jgi:hypothetical protein
MFAVDDIDPTLERLCKRGAQLVGDLVRYKDAYRLSYIRGPEGILIGLAQSHRVRVATEEEIRADGAGGLGLRVSESEEFRV